MRNTTLAELGGWALAALVCLVATIVQFVSARHADTAYARGYAAAVDSVKAASRVAPDSAWFTGHGADCDTVIVWGWHR